MLGKYRKIIGLGLIILLGLSLVACGQAEQQGEKESISFAMSGGYPPFNYFDENNQLVGFDIDVGKEVAKRLGKEYTPVTTAWDGIIEGLRAGRYDGILGSMAITEDRLEVVNFSDPYYYSGAQLIVRADSGIKTPDDLQEAVIGLVTGTTFENDAQALAGVKEVRLYEDDNQTLLDLGNGRTDGVITDRVVGVNAMQKLDYDYELAGSVLRSEEMAVAVRKEDEKLLQEINQALTDMREDGTLQAISEKWFGVDITVN